MVNRRSQAVYREVQSVRSWPQHKETITVSLLLPQLLLLTKAPLQPLPGPLQANEHITHLLDIRLDAVEQGNGVVGMQQWITLQLVAQRAGLLD